MAASWVLCVVLCVLAVIGFVGALTSAAPSSTFASGERVTVTLDPADEPVLYRTGNAAGQASCELYGPSADGLALTVSTGMTLGLNDVTWNSVFDITVPARGEYQVACVGEASPTFGVGTAIGPGVLLWPLLGLLGFIIATTTTVVVLVKRSRARRGP